VTRTIFKVQNFILPFGLFRRGLGKSLLMFDMSNKTSASDMEDSTPLITDRCDMNYATMDTKTSGSNTENKTGDSHKPIYTMRIGFKKNNKRKKISNNRNRKGEHEAGCDTEPSVNTWDQAITSAETRENAKQDPI
jgi:hypothetical protein